MLCSYHHYCNQTEKNTNYTDYFRYKDCSDLFRLLDSKSKLRYSYYPK